MIKGQEMRVYRLDPVQSARNNMVRSQLKPNGVVNRTILNIFNEISRENFVPVSLYAMAYGDATIFCGVPGRYIFAPQTLGLFLQNLNLVPNDKVLLIGGNYGYTATVLTELECQVFVIESQPTLLSKCREKLKKYNTVIESGPLKSGLAEHGPYQAIIIEVGLKEVPNEIVNQLADGGRVALCIVNDVDQLSRAHVFEKKMESLDQVISFEANMPLCLELDESIKFRF